MFKYKERHFAAKPNRKPHRQVLPVKFSVSPIAAIVRRIQTNHYAKNRTTAPTHAPDSAKRGFRGKFSFQLHSPFDDQSTQNYTKKDPLPIKLIFLWRPTKELAIRPAGDFLWVDYQNDHLKNRELLRYRQAFVRSRHHRLRREKAVQQFSTATGPFSTEHSPPSTQTADAHGSRTHRRRLAKCDHRDDLDSCAAQQTPVLVSSLQAGVLDGGPALALSANQNPNVYFHHFWFWKKALEDPTLMQIKLSISASHRAAILTASGASTAIVQKPAQDALRLRVGTIKSLRCMLQDAATVSSEETIFIIAHIIVSEAFEANSEAAETHMNGLKKIIAATGGMDTLGHGTLSMLYW
ncbi:uncharacterized protein N7477_006010 [Penicillium maclennaniae]|uniref:uncharacterized protein n=1 Tax=Penicillium maclennaniae TaxID=1343394 RepID=UPI00253FA9AE|nr:uncharacterized protein N7477_006010 [Penicillium maclennaniae]KAJ5670647.1 hypothetical protein N7477_006010 [Penicillium maclennaniae]